VEPVVPPPAVPAPEGPPKTLAEKYREGKEAEKIARSREAVKAADRFRNPVKSTETDPAKVRKEVETKLGASWTRARDAKLTDFVGVVQKPTKKEEDKDSTTATEEEDPTGEAAPSPSPAAVVPVKTEAPAPSPPLPHPTPSPSKHGKPNTPSPRPKQTRPADPPPAQQPPPPQSTEKKGGEGDEGEVAPEKNYLHANIRFISTMMRDKAKGRAALPERPAPDAFCRMLMKFAEQVVDGYEALDMHMSEPLVEGEISPDFYVAMLIWRFRSVMSDATLKGHPELAKLVGMLKGRRVTEIRLLDKTSERDETRTVRFTYDDDGVISTVENLTSSVYDRYWETLIFLKDYLVRLHQCLTDNMNGLDMPEEEEENGGRAGAGEDPDARKEKMARSMCLAVGFIGRQWTMFRAMMTLDLFPKGQGPSSVVST